MPIPFFSNYCKNVNQAVLGSFLFSLLSATTAFELFKSASSNADDPMKELKSAIGGALAGLSLVTLMFAIKAYLHLGDPEEEGAQTRLITPPPAAV